MKAPGGVWVAILNREVASPYPQVERGRSISPTGKGLVHIPNRDGAMQKAWSRAPYQKWREKMPGALTLPHGLCLQL